MFKTIKKPKSNSLLFKIEYRTIIMSDEFERERYECLKNTRNGLNLLFYLKSKRIQRIQHDISTLP